MWAEFQEEEEDSIGMWEVYVDPWITESVDTRSADMGPLVWL